MTLIDFEQDRQSHPVDVIEQIAALNDWTFERAGDDEITISVSGGWADYHVSFSWMEDREAIHLACAFDLKVPETRKARGDAADHARSTSSSGSAISTCGAPKAW